MRARLLFLLSLVGLVTTAYAAEGVGREGLLAAPPGATTLRLSGVREGGREGLTGERGEGGEIVLDLVRREGVAPDGELIVHGAQGERVLPLPRTRYWTGRVEGRPGSRVTLAQRGDGEVRGLLVDGASVASLRSAPGDASLEFRPVGSGERATPFRCATDDLLGADGPSAPWDPPVVAGVAGVAAESVEVAAHSARVAVETDFEYFQIFGDTTAAAEYALDLLAFSSTIYASEVGADLIVASVSLWTSSGDPWAQSNPTCALYEFGKYWNDNRQGSVRTIAHFLSGKSNGGGVAWVGVLCSDAFSYDISLSGCGGMTSVSNYGGAYGYTGTIDGNFQPGNPQPIWDTIAVTHEIGHNFGSPHTHCYANYGGSSSHVDQCWTSASAGCYNGTTKTLPGVGSVTGGTAGAGNGTIMSYCHLLSGGYPNIALTFGLDHPYGVLAERVPQRMAAHVASRAASNPSCLAPIAPGAVFSDDFETGTLWRWN
ncbi:MAG: hypothetical protein KDB94_00030 [Acidobacteria bacterium]|nr:hypothetical protein [Acidobacteriota bacterium]